MDKSSTTDRGTLTSHEVKGEAKCITAKNHPLRMMVNDKVMVCMQGIISSMLSSWCGAV